MIKVFIDASVLIAALISPVGGSTRLLEYSQHKKILAISSQTVLNEVKANLHKIKTVEVNIDHFVVKKSIIVRKRVTTKEIKPFAGIVEEKDTHIIAGAILTKADYLVTLDKKHLLKKEVKEKFRKLEIVSPKQLLKVIRAI